MEADFPWLMLLDSFIGYLNCGSVFDFECIKVDFITLFRQKPWLIQRTK